MALRHRLPTRYNDIQIQLMVLKLFEVFEFSIIFHKAHEMTVTLICLIDNSESEFRTANFGELLKMDSIVSFFLAIFKSPEPSSRTSSSKLAS